MDSLITGIGINTTVKDFPEELLDTVGAVTGSYSKSALAASVISKLLDFTEDLDNRAFMKAYREKCLVLGKNGKRIQGSI